MAHRQEYQERIDQLELQRTMKAIVVPALDADVCKLLRQLGEPITLFGEREASLKRLYITNQHGLLNWHEEVR